MPLDGNLINDIKYEEERFYGDDFPEHESSARILGTYDSAWHEPFPRSTGGVGYVVHAMAERMECA